MLTLDRLLHCVLIVLVPQTYCYIFDVNYAYNYKTNKTGYTALLLQKEPNGFKLIAGAPRHDTVTVCKTGKCQHFSYSEKNVAGFEMLGAAIDGGDNVDDPLYVCAPRFITQIQYRVNGRCFAWHDHFTAIHSLDNVYQQVQMYNNTYEFLFAHGQAGFSVKYIGNNEFIAGAPGVLSWKGTIIKHTTYESKDILHPEKKVNRHSYLGYAIEYGVYYFANVKKRCVIAGAPRGDNLLGQVYIFDYEYIKDFTLKILKGDQLSSYYGSSLLATANDLFVGAPMYTTKSYEEGCVFIYHNDQVDLVFADKICGQHMGGRFGTAIAKIGFFDSLKVHLGIAISAPYAEGGAGIVYIYVKTDNEFKEIQQISGSSISDVVRGFGLSLSRGLDIDENSYNDIAIGSFLSEELTVLRSRKILRFTGFFNSYPDKIGTETKNTTLGYCFWYFGRNESDTINVNIVMDSDNRVAVINANRTVTADIGSKKCEDFVLILKPHAFDSPLPLKVKITNKLVECPTCPVAYPKNTSQTHEIPFATGCGEDNVCTPDLRVQARFENISELILGSRDSVSLLVSVSNLGETAYLTKMNVTLPAEIRQFPAACSKVEDAIYCDISNRLTLNQNKHLQFQFDVKHLHPFMKEIKVNVTVNSAGNGKGSVATVTVTLPVVLKSNVTLIGFSNPEYLENRVGVNFTHEYLVFNNGPSPLLRKTLEFRLPEGVTSISGGVVNAFVISPLADECIPFEEPPVREPRDSSKLKQALTDMPANITYRIDCTSNNLITCKMYQCIVGELAANSSLKFKFRIEVKTSVMLDALGESVEDKSLFSIESIVRSLDMTTRQETASIQTVLFRVLAENADIWMWIVIAVIGSIIILSVIIGVLYKLNFFARPMREKLKLEEENKNERQCMLVNDDFAEDTSEVFSDIHF